MQVTWDPWNVDDEKTDPLPSLALRGAMRTLVLSLSYLHTAGMRRRILAVLESDDPGITPAARAAAASALSDPSSLSDRAIWDLSEALTHMAGRLVSAPEKEEPGRSSS